MENITAGTRDAGKKTGTEKQFTAQQGHRHAWFGMAASPISRFYTHHYVKGKPASTNSFQTQKLTTKSPQKHKPQNLMGTEITQASVQVCCYGLTLLQVCNWNDFQ